ncbi:MAG: hypothetical protein C0615_09390 [Desulfuromonas sp.]|nr:MAG: hypothetical protein C0615_09390 [Desulfuromonas sp.]
MFQQPKLALPLEERGEMKEKKLGEILLECELINTEQLEQALDLQQGSDKPLGRILVEQEFLSERDLNVTLDYYNKREKLGQILIRNKVINKGQLEHALEISQQRRISLGDTLVQLNMISEDQLATALSNQYNMPYLQLKEYDLTPGLGRFINKNYAVKNRAVVVEQKNDSVILAMAIPLHPYELAELEAAIRHKIIGAIARDSDIKFAHEQIYGTSRYFKNIDLSLEDYSDEEISSQYVLEHNIEYLLKKILTVAVNAGASDIHLENTEDGMFPRFRIDGILQKLDLDSSSEEIRTHGPSLTSKVKVQSDLDIAERRRPQDGSFRVQIVSNGKKRKVDFRVSIIPTRFGENVVIRILDKIRPTALDALGFPPTELNELERLLDKPTGIYLVTGPTGSGKTSTLYAILNKVNTPGVKILTAEDPIEYSLGDISQCEVNEKIGNSFAELLRSFLRQDPDYIMVGEMRDLETSTIAIRAALTGHTVFSTLHTNDATSAITRLVDMGVDPSLIASTVRGVIAQRLVRVNCLHCREAHQTDGKLLQGLPLILTRRIKQLHGAGCALCNYTGFSGRRLLSEMWIPTREESVAIGRTTDNAELRDLMFHQAGRKTMLQNGLELVRNGETTLEELLRSVPAEQIEEIRKRTEEIGDSVINIG